MGNVNAREDGNGSPSRADEESGNSGSVQEAISASNAVSSELMGQSPPTSPRATQSPLMFTPQVSFFPFFLFLVFWVIVLMGFYRFPPEIV